MKITQTLLLLLTLTFTNSACLKTSADSAAEVAPVAAEEESDEALTIADFAGTWVSNCVYDAQSNDYTITTSSVTIDGVFATDSDHWISSETCSGEPDSSDMQLSGTASIGSIREDGSYDYNVAITSPISLTVYLAIKKLSATTFVVGQGTGDGDNGMSEEARSTVLDTNRVFTLVP